MRNQLLLFLALSIMSVSISAQKKVKLKDVSVYNQYIQPPSNSFSDEIVTYQVDPIVEGTASGSLSAEHVKRKINLTGYHKVDVGGDIIIKPSLGKLTISPWDNKINNKKSKEKTWKEYYAQVTYNSTFGYTILSKDGVVIEESDLTKGAQAKKTSTFSSSAKLSAWKKANSSKFYKDIRSNELSANVSAIAGSIDRNFGLLGGRDKLKFKYLKEKKHREYKEWKATEDQIKAAFEVLTPQSLEAFREKIIPLIEFWEEREPGYKLKDKQEKKLKYACQYNLGMAYMVLEEFENALKYADLVAKGDVDEKDGRKLREKIEKKQKMMSEANWITLHKKIEMSDEVKSNLAKAVEEKAAAIEGGDISQLDGFKTKMKYGTTSVSKPGMVYHESGRVDEGYFVYEPAYKAVPNFMRKQSLRFGYLQDNEIQSATLNRPKIDSFSIDGLMYYIEDVKVGSGLFSKTIKNAVVTDRLEFNRTRVIDVYKMNDEMEWITPVLYHKESEEYHYIEGTILKGFSKVVADAIKDCKRLSDKVKNTDYKGKNLEALPGILEEYDACK